MQNNLWNSISVTAYSLRSGEHSGTFMGVENVLYLYDRSYMDIYICQNLLKHTLKMGIVYNRIYF